MKFSKHINTGPYQSLNAVHTNEVDYEQCKSENICRLETNRPSLLVVKCKIGVKLATTFYSKKQKKWNILECL